MFNKKRENVTRLMLKLHSFRLLYLLSFNVSSSDSSWPSPRHTLEECLSSNQVLSDSLDINIHLKPGLALQNSLSSLDMERIMSVSLSHCLERIKPFLSEHVPSVFPSSTKLR